MAWIQIRMFFTVISCPEINLDCGCGAFNLSPDWYIASSAETREPDPSFGSRALVR